MLKYKIIELYSGQQITEFYNKEKAEQYIKENQHIGKIGQLKGKPTLKLKVVDTEKQREYNSISRNRRKMKMEYF